MARFNFRLQSVLNIKEQLESQARMEFGQAMATLLSEQEKLEALKLRKAQYLDEARELRSAGLSVNELKENEHAIKRMDEYIEGQIEQIKLCERAVERARLKLTEAMKERKAQERLKERAFEQFWEEEKQAEAKEIDELVTYRFGVGDTKSDG